METLWQDLRYAVRMLRKQPGFTLVAVLTLAVGIGASTAIFSVVDAVLLRPLPYKGADRLVDVLMSETGTAGPSKLFVSYSDFLEWKNSTSLEQVEACTWARGGQTLSWRGRAQRALVIPATEGFFSLLGAHAALGRTFEPEDSRSGPAVVLSNSFWRSRLGGASYIAGESVTLDGQSCTIIGVMPADFEFYPKQTEMWLLIGPDSDFARNPLNSIVIVFARLKPGISRTVAQAELSTLHQHVKSASPPGSWIAQVEPLVDPLQEDFTWLAGRNLRTSLLVLLAAVAFVLLIACVNVANLLLGRGAQRQKELAIRIALGSRRSRLIRQLLTECLLLSLLGAALGSLLAYVSIRYFRAASPIELPPGNAVTVNLRVLAFSGGLAVLTTLLFGLVPAFKSSRFDLNEVLKASGRTLTRGALSHRVGKLLVIAEVTLSFVLLVGAGLLIRSVVALGDAPLGFRLDRMLTGRVNLPAGRYQDPETRLTFYDKMTSALSALSGVDGVGLTSALPLTGPGSSALNIDARQSQQPAGEVGDVGIRVVSPGYLTLLDIPLLQGRHFDTGDRKDSQPVAIVNEVLVQRYFPGEDPIGKRIKVGKLDDTNPWLAIVGIVGNVKEATVYKEMDYIVAPFVYRPVCQAADRSLAFAIRTTTGSVGVLAGAIEGAVSDIDPDVPVSDVQAMQERVTTFLSQARFRAVLLGVFSVVALLLASIGIYGVLSQSVLQRTNEIGIRSALGAQPRDILRLVIGQGMLLAATGVAIGLIAAGAVARFLASLLYGVSATDPLTLIVIALLLMIVAFVACYLPARRATKIDPMIALRYE